ncbi:MAG TPA: hypothetical protein VG733_12680 [Chthoniobacteraceae bacterium]|nr:hypothetical protein [Chthoniobacteraceae bacterium]
MRSLPLATDYPGGAGAVFCAFLWVVTVFPAILLTFAAWGTVLISKSIPKAVVGLAKFATGVAAISLGAYLAGICFESYDYLVLREEPETFLHNLEASKGGAMALMILLFLTALTAYFHAKQKFASS